MKTLLFCLLAFCVFAVPALAGDEPGDEPQPTADEMVAGLEAMCAGSADARAARQAEASLYDRLGGTEKIHEIFTETIRLHDEDPDFADLMKGVDRKKLAVLVTQFVSAGIGGPDVYEGRTLAESHANMHLTNAEFLAAGGDIMESMKTLGHGEDEINEMVCIFVSLRDQVVFDDDEGGTHAH